MVSRTPPWNRLFEAYAFSRDEICYRALSFLVPTGGAAAGAHLAGATARPNRYTYAISWQSRALSPVATGVALTAVGLAMLIGGWLWHARLSALLAGATHTQGTVVAIERPRLQSAHFPVFAFRDAAGSRYEVRSEYPSEKWKEGDAVDVVYDARSPHTAVLTETASQSPAPVAVVFMGLLFIVVGVSTVVLAPRFRGSSITWQSRPLPPLVGGGLLVCIGLGLLTAAYLWRAKEASFLRGATHAQGTVVAIEGYRGSHPVFSFRDAQGHQYEIRSAYANQSYRAGDTVDVAYDPRSPYDAVLADSVPQAVARFFLFLLGTVFVASGVSNAWRQYRYQQE